MNQEEIIAAALARGLSFTVTTRADGSRSVRVAGANSGAAVNPSTERSRRFRERRALQCNAPTSGNATDATDATQCNAKETQPSPPSSPLHPPPTPTPVRYSARGAASAAEAIYQAYPRKVAKPQALRSIAKALASPPAGIAADVWPSQLLAITERFAKLRKGEDPQFTPHPATWFNGQRYNDDPSTWRTESAPRVAGNARNGAASERGVVTWQAPPAPKVRAEDRATPADLRSIKEAIVKQPSLL